MNLEQLDGFFAALIVAPDMVMPSEYLPLIWGSDTLEDDAFADEEEARQILALLMDYWNAIGKTLHAEGLYLPIFLEDAGGVAHGRDWARGFMQGVNLRRESWAELITNENEAGALLPIALMAGEVDPNWPATPLNDEKREEMLTLMAAGLARMHHYFAPHRRDLARAEADKHTYRRAGSKVGRNDPCPCGSGKKYKHCCASNSGRVFH